MTEKADEKLKHCLAFVLERLKTHQRHYADNPNPPPLFVGLNGVQGVGKTVTVNILRSTLSSPPYNLPTISFSLDDLYLTHDDQVYLASSNPSNPLLQHRGQPSTHDIPLGLQVFDSLRKNLPTRIPAYDKSAFNGEGDRLPEEQWELVNADEDVEKQVKVVIFEGWCVGFKARTDDDLRRVWEHAVRSRHSTQYDGQLGYVKLEDVASINKALKAYDAFTNQLDALIHIDAESIRYVYDWRQEQEQTLRSVKGSGMTIEQVNQFVNGYYPSYELYTSTLREGAFKPSANNESRKAEESNNWHGKQLRLLVDKQRKLIEVKFF